MIAPFVLLGQLFLGAAYRHLQIPPTEAGKAIGMTIVTVREVHPTTGELAKFTMRFPIDMFREYAA